MSILWLILAVCVSWLLGAYSAWKWSQEELTRRTQELGRIFSDREDSYLIRLNESNNSLERVNIRCETLIKECEELKKKYGPLKKTSDKSKKKLTKSKEDDKKLQDWSPYEDVVL